MSAKEIKLAEIFPSKSLVTRASAIEIARLVKSFDEEYVVIGFNNVETVTRSFFNQLDHEIDAVCRSHHKEVKISNLSFELKKLYARVRRESSDTTKRPPRRDIPVSHI